MHCCTEQSIEVQVQAGRQVKGMVGQNGTEKVRQGRTVGTQYTGKWVVSTYELYSSGSQCIMEDAMRNGLLGWARAAAIMVASIPTSMRRKNREEYEQNKSKEIR